MTNTSARRSSNLLQGWHRFNRSAATTLLIPSLCGVILGSSARAQNPQDPSVLVPTAPEARDAAADPNAKVCRCARNRREEIDRAIRDHFATLYQDYCRGFESGRIFDIQMEEIRIQGNSAIVSYVLMLFETCEEGAPLSEASRYKEHWIRRANGWEPEEIAPRLAP